MLSELNRAGLVDNVNEIIEFMDSIDEKYGLEDSCETELSRLYIEITDGFIPHEDFEKMKMIVRMNMMKLYNILNLLNITMKLKENIHYV